MPVRVLNVYTAQPAAATLWTGGQPVALPVQGFYGWGNLTQEIVLKPFNVAQQQYTAWSPQGNVPTPLVNEQSQTQDYIFVRRKLLYQNLKVVAGAISTPFKSDSYPQNNLTQDIRVNLKPINAAVQQQFCQYGPQVPAVSNPWSGVDGRLNAPSGTPQFAGLLNKYGPSGFTQGRYTWPSTTVFNSSTGHYYQPQWFVAGIDYAVGPHPGVTLSDPTTISISGVTVNAGSHTVTIGSGAAGATISGIDFSLDNSWQVVVSAANITITDCNFASGSNTPGFLSLLQGDNNSNTNLTVSYCSFNGFDQTGSNSCIVGNIRGATFTYCIFENTNQDLLDFGGSGATAVPIVVKYCVFRNDGAATGHADWLQVGGATYTCTLQFCMAYSIGGAGGGSMGWCCDTLNGGQVVGTNDYGWNTIVLGAGANVNHIFSNFFTSGTVAVHDNFSDQTGNNGPYAIGQAAVSYSNNTNMLTGGEVSGF